MAADPTQLQLAQITAILGSEQAPFETLISHLMSAANDQRSQAESLFNLCKQTQPDTLSLKLAHLLHSSPHPEARAMSAILLRKLLTRDDSYLYPSLSPSTQSTIKSTLLNSVINKSTKNITKKLCDTVSELAASIVPENGWPELLPFRFNCVSSENPNHKESALLIFAQLAQYIGETLVPYLDTLHSVFSGCLATGMNPDVRVAALGATINLIQCLEKASEREKFQNLLPLMMQTLTEALTSGQEATAQEALELLIELAGSEPRFLRRQIVEQPKSEKSAISNPFLFMLTF